MRTAFAFPTGGRGLESLVHSFVDDATDGEEPMGGLMMDGAGNLYGTTEHGGASGCGTVFEIN